MRSISSFQEAQSAINDILNRLDTLSVKNWNRRQTRIVNAHPSVDEYDYVVRKELDALKGSGNQTVASSGNGAEKCTFGLGINSLVTTGTNLCPPYIVAKRGGVILDFVVAAVGVACTGTPIQVQTRVGATSIFTTPLEIPVGTITAVEKTDFSLNTFNFKDIILCDVLQAGNAYPGTNLVVVMVFK